MKSGTGVAGPPQSARPLEQKHQATNTIATAHRRGCYRVHRDAQLAVIASAWCVQCATCARPEAPAGPAQGSYDRQKAGATALPEPLGPDPDKPRPLHLLFYRNLHRMDASGVEKVQGGRVSPSARQSAANASKLVAIGEFCESGAWGRWAWQFCGCSAGRLAQRRAARGTPAQSSSGQNSQARIRQRKVRG